MGRTSGQEDTYWRTTIAEKTTETVVITEGYGRCDTHGLEETVAFEWSR
jgi:hypothetical protein